MSKNNPNQRPTPSKLVRPKPAQDTTAGKKPQPVPKEHQTIDAMPLGPRNYLQILIGIATLVLGFILLSIDGFVDATEFSVSLHISPFVIIAGYAHLIWALMLRPKAEEANASLEA